MLLPYPQSIPCQFDSFPIAIDIRLGILAPSMIEGCSLGSKITVYRTKKCGIPQGAYIDGAELPSFKMIYSDTGDDANFSIKVSFSGYGTFYKYSSYDKYVRFQLYKTICVETGLLGEKCFGDLFDCETFIESLSDVLSILDPSKVISYYDYVDYDKEINGVLFGGIFYRITDGAKITLVSNDGVRKTYTNINGLIFVQ